MGRFTNTDTGVTVSVDDSKDDRFTGDNSGWESAAPAEKAAKKAAPSKTDNK